MATGPRDAEKKLPEDPACRATGAEERPARGDDEPKVIAFPGASLARAAGGREPAPAASPAYRLCVTDRITVGADRAWDLVSRPGEYAEWFGPFVFHCHFDGRERVLRTACGTIAREEILEIDPAARRFRYRLYEHRLPAGPIDFTIEVRPFDGGALVSWSAVFDSHDPASVRRVLGAILRWGIRSLEAYCRDAA